MLYLTRTTNKVRKTKNIQLAIFQIPLDKFGKEMPKLLELNSTTTLQFIQQFRQMVRFCISQVIVLEDMVVWIFTTLI